MKIIYNQSELTKIIDIAFRKSGAFKTNRKRLRTQHLRYKRRLKMWQ